MDHPRKWGWANLTLAWLASAAMIICHSSPLTSLATPPRRVRETGIDDKSTSEHTEYPVTNSGEVVAFSRFFGGSAEDTVRDIWVDAAGSAFVSGGTASANLLTTTGAYDRTLNTSGNPIHDVFVTKLSANGLVVWSTYLGGPDYDRAYAIELDAAGNVYVAGRAGPGFPTTTGVVQRTFGGDVNPNGLYGQQDGFVAKFSPNGSQLLWATYFGGDDHSFIRDIDVDDAGNVYLAMTSVSRPNPHITAGAYQTFIRGGEDGVIAKLSPDGRTVLWATYFGGSGLDVGTPSIRVGGDGSVYVLGFTTSTDIPTTAGAHDRTYNGGGGDLHVARFSADGRQLLWGTYLGGSAVEFTETHGLALTPEGDVIVAATTKSSDFPTTAGALQQSYGGSGGSGTGGNTNYPGDGFITKLSAANGQLLASTFLGGRFGEGIEGVMAAPDGTIVVGGATFSDDFPVTPDAYQSVNLGKGDAFVAKLSADLTTLLYGSYLGGRDEDFARAAATDANGNLYLAGHTKSTDWPVETAFANGLAGGIDGMIASFAAVNGCGAAGAACDDGDPCTFNDRCDLHGSCLGTVEPGCTSCSTTAECNDGLNCTADACVAGQCQNTDTCTDDGDPCNGTEFCHLTTGACAHSGDPCPGACDPEFGCPCQAPLVVAAGSKYLAITPLPLGSPSPTTLRITSPDLPCLSKYVGMPIPFDVDGDLVPDGGLATLVTNAAERAVLTPAFWGGTVYVSAADIIPTDRQGANLVPARYVVHVDCGLYAASSMVQMPQWCDLDGSGVVNFTDVQLAIAGFLGDFDPSRGLTLASCDVIGTPFCEPDALINVTDIQRTILAFQGETYAQVMALDPTACTPCP